MTTLDDIRGRATISVWPELGQLVGVSKNSAYGMVSRGEIPSLRLGGRILVPVQPLLRILGAETETTPNLQDANQEEVRGRRTNTQEGAA